MYYRLNGNYMCDVAVLPAAVASYLRIAGETQLKVLLWAATSGKAGCDAAACAEALGGRVTVSACEDALRFWEAEGLLVAEGEPSPKPTAKAASKAATPPSSAVTEAVPLPTASYRAPAPSTAPVVTPVLRPAAVKPQLAEVIQRQKSSRDFALLLNEASLRLGKALSPADQETLLYLFDTAGLPAEVILMVVVYAKSNGKGNMRYIEKTALDWADRDIRTVAAADAFLCALSRREDAYARLAEMLSLPPRPTASNKELAAKWLLEWQVSEELLSLAAETCLEKIGKFQYSYIDRVLESWRAEGWDTPQKVKAGKKRGGAKPDEKKSVSSRAGGFDVEKYEEMVRSHTPKYRKKGQT